MKNVLFTIPFLSLLLFFSCKNTSDTNNTTDNGQDKTIQILEPVTWEYEVLSNKIGVYSIVFTATIDDEWYVYSQELAEDGPIPTSIFFDESVEGIELLGDPTEEGEVVKEGYDELFDMDIKKFGKKAVFTQTIKVDTTTVVSGYLEYMTCDDMQCLFPDPVVFSFEATNE